MARGPGWESEWGFLSGEGRGSDAQTGVRSAAACGLREWERDGACALAHLPACRVGGSVQTSETCLGNGAVLVRWTPAAAETCFGTNKPTNAVFFRVLT